jgi:glycosyltransferase involved in cell wall biosynthesis
MFSIIIPTFNNLNYLKICISSLKKNSKFDHDLIVHINDGNDGTIDYIKNNNITYTYSENNIGLCSAVNIAAKKSKTNYILYSHDDMYFCPDWDIVLKNELTTLNTKLFYLSGSMIEKNSGHIKLDCGSDFQSFNEKKLLENYKNYKFRDFQGSHWAPHLIHKDLWIKIGGFSEEFNPGIGSDPDLNMKLWKENVRIFKGIADFRVYHFGSISLRKKSNIKKNNGTKTFLKKWGITPKFFKKHYLNSDTDFEGPLSEPVCNLNYFIGLFICKVKLFFTI